MATMMVRALYDFAGDPGNGELCVQEGDIIHVSSQDVGGGWWEGTIEGSEPGLFPAAYVEVWEEVPPAAPPPPLPPQVIINSSLDDGNSSYGSSSSYDQFDHIEVIGGEFYDNSSVSAISDLTDNISESDLNFGTTGGPRRPSNARLGTVKKSMNRFSNFVKSGGEEFLLGHKCDVSILESDMIIAVDTTDGVCWQPDPTQFTCKVTDAEKKSKFKGMKSYISYNITPSHTRVSVGHRFKHFDWLYERLLEKFPCLSIPPLPDKQVHGRYSEDLVKKRRYLLEKWMNRVARHPVLSQSFVFNHFVSVCSETREKEWKEGKRKAELDKVVGTQFFYTIDNPPATMSQIKLEAEVDRFKDFVRNMDESSKKLIEVGENNWDKLIRSYKGEYKKIASGFDGLKTSFQTENSPSSIALTQAVEHTAQQYDAIGDLCGEQPKRDMTHLLELLKEYSGILSTYPEIANVHKGGLTKLKECQKLQEEDKLQYSEVAGISHRMGAITSCTFAEMHHFHTERCKDFKATMQLFLREQVKYHQEIISKLNSSIAMYEQVPD